MHSSVVYYHDEAQSLRHKLFVGDASLYLYGMNHVCSLLTSTGGYYVVLWVYYPFAILYIVLAVEEEGLRPLRGGAEREWFKCKCEKKN